jgi:hypothetical protein
MWSADICVLNALIFFFIKVDGKDKEDYRGGKESKGS